MTEEYNPLKFVEELDLFDLAVSLGGVESLVCHPSTMTHESYAIELQEKIGISAGLFRFAIGIEHVDDLINDLAQALDLAKK
ncbi:PLP-dependent transferase [Carnobacterium sp. FSL E2-0243]|uniref:PLP-dependent transferase n=1 Tax=Carnobacterium sp. FSL E2-0243 TaxID=2921365 RepID=UPI0030FACB13